MTKRGVEPEDYIGEMVCGGLVCRVWVDRFVGARIKGAQNHLPSFVAWWKEHGNGSSEAIYCKALPMAVSIEAKQ